MSISLRRNMCFFFPESVVDNIFLMEKVKDIYEDEFDLEAKFFLEKLNNEINNCILDGSLEKDEITDVLYSMTVGFSKKSELKRLSDYVSHQYQYDDHVGVSFQTSWDESVSRFKHNVDWYRLVDANEFLQEPIIGSLHCGNSCLSKVDSNGFKIVHESDLVNAYLKAVNHPILRDLAPDDMFYHSKTKKAIGEIMSREDFYVEMKKMGYSSYVNPAYYLTAKVGDILKPEITRKMFEDAGKMSVISVWR